ncbi:unnamed protein product [Fraxinus pennsylvanica]|uniref:Calcineurin-like phosphoesterase domain-containing protein n=1 Tax=Fraxinus pennsylvanica TaxID=56036 RepID=A0AAD1Z0Y6_9LAMI|nr:unnamed protein product [Fraxinus pennsylvanica]
MTYKLRLQLLITDYGMFHFCLDDTEHDWREGTEQYRVLDYSSNKWYGEEGSFAEPMERESLVKLWRKYKVDIAFYGHVHNFERTCPFYHRIFACLEWLAGFTGWDR